MSTLNQKTTAEQDRLTALDRLRYTRNTTSSRLVLLAILFNILYFVSIYKSDAANYYYTMLTGGSIIYNLIFLLAAFLSEEGVKVRKPRFPQLLVVLGLLQIARIFIIPVQAHGAVYSASGVENIVMGNAQFIRVCIYLTLSGVCCILGGITSAMQNKKLADYMKTLAEAR